MLPRLYRQTFGEVLGTPRQKLNGGMPILLVMLGSLADTLVHVGQPAPELRSGRPRVLFNLDRLERLALAHPSSRSGRRGHHRGHHHGDGPSPVESLGGPGPRAIRGLSLVFHHSWLTDGHRGPVRSPAAGFLALGSRSSAASGVQQALARADSGGTRAAIAGVVCMRQGALSGRWLRNSRRSRFRWRSCWRSWGVKCCSPCFRFQRPCVAEHWQPLHQS